MLVAPGPIEVVQAIIRWRREALAKAIAACAIAEILDLLQHRIGFSRGEHVTGNQQNGQAVDVGDRGGGDHIGGAGADRRAAGHHAAAA